MKYAPLDWPIIVQVPTDIIYDIYLVLKVPSLCVSPTPKVKIFNSKQLSIKPSWNTKIIELKKYPCCFITSLACTRVVSPVETTLPFTKHRISLEWNLLYACTTVTIYHWKESSDQFLSCTKVSLIINFLALLSTCVTKKNHKQTKLKDYLMQLFVAWLTCDCCHVFVKRIFFPRKYSI